MAGCYALRGFLRVELVGGGSIKVATGLLWAFRLLISPSDLFSSLMWKLLVPTYDLNVRQPFVRENGIHDNDATGVDGGVTSLCKTPNACPAGHKA
eukprot:scaffold119290_cov28-Attheya_sp.AAC.1